MKPALILLLFLNKHVCKRSRLLFELENKAMKVLIADDEPVTLKMLEFLLKKWGYETISVLDGNIAWEILTSESPPQMAILDWMMPGKEGADICRHLRAKPENEGIYIILLTSKDQKEHIVEGLNAGANDYITKPFDNEELKARILVGKRMIHLQETLKMRIKELQDANSHIKILQSIMLPICSYCKKIRDDQNYWQQLESYFYRYADVKFSHGICPECYEKYVKPQLEDMMLEDILDKE